MAADPLQHHGNRRADAIQIVPVRQPSVREGVLVPADGVEPPLRPFRMGRAEGAAAGDQLIHGADAGDGRLIARLRQLHEVQMAVVEAGDDGAAPAVDGPAPGSGQRENFRI